MRRLLLHQASGAAGDALVALALAGSLFFSVPETTARGRVLLYLGLTMAPFAVVSPFLARILDRFKGSLRWAMVVTSVGRATLAWLLASRLESLLMFPIVFGILMMSRASLVVRGAVLPHVVPEGRTLVEANSSLSRIGAIAGIVAGIPGLLLIRWPGVQVELLFAAAVYYLGTLPALRLSASSGRRSRTQRDRARSAASSPIVRQAIVATAGMRFLVGFLVFHLAFALRRENLGSLGLGLLVGSAALGGLGGALLAPRLRRTLSEPGIIAAALVAAGIAGLVVGRWFNLYTASALVFVFGVASGVAKVAFDSIVQTELPEGARGWAFARSESTLQLAWVAGAMAPLLIAIPAGPGVFATGVAAQVLALVYVAGRRRAAPALP
ncbi:MAG TPA: MFS transporter [Actinomycetota bacterium]|nr:MFS transporter [Actinomycetota bacterium]